MMRNFNNFAGRYTQIRRRILRKPSRGWLLLSALALALILSYGNTPPKVGVSLANSSTGDTQIESTFPSAWQNGGTHVLFPEGDSYVRGGSFADSNFGNENRLTVKKASPSYSREALIKFDPSSVTGSITTATLELMPFSVGSDSAMTNEVSLVTATAWSEQTVTWVNQPPAASFLGSWKPVRGKRVAIDVTYPVQTAIRQGQQISFKVYSPNEISSDAWVHYCSKEGAVSDSPRLVIKTVSMLYPNATDTDSWDSSHWNDGISREIFQSGDANDPTGWSQRRGEGRLMVNGQGIATMQGSEPRIYLNGVPSKFWKNVEATVYYKRMQDDGTPWGGLSIGARGGPDGHTSLAPCTATTYYGRLRHDGYTDLEKELKHPESEVRARASVWNGQTLPYNQWVGIKFVVYNIENDSKVKLELYRDLTEGLGGGQWEKIAEYTDAGGWGSASGCGYPSDQIITQGGGVVFLRNTGVQDAQYKWFSVREINPP